MATDSRQVVRRDVRVASYVTSADAAISYIQGTLEKNPSVKVFLSGSSQHFLSLDMGVLSGLRFAQGRFSLESFRVVNFLHVLVS